MLSMTPEQRQIARKAAVLPAVAAIKPNMIVGLGTGDTATQAILALAARSVPNLRCVATSEASALLARNVGLSLVKLDEIFEKEQKPIDVTIDGADEIDPHLQLTKGRGGALLSEKLVAHASKELWIVADSDKKVAFLGQRCAIPVEIVPFGFSFTLERLKVLGPAVELRMKNGAPYRTDGGHFIADVTLFYHSPPDLFRRACKQTLGVVETGMFLQEATCAFVGNADGTVQTLYRKSR